MKSSLLLMLTALLSAVAAAAGNRLLTEEDMVSAAIAGGHDAAVNRFRWMASLRYGSGPLQHDPFCGGILISSTVLLTSASCTIPDFGIPVAATRFPRVWLGGFDRRGGEHETRQVTATLIHAGWNRTKNAALNDIALMRLGTGRNALAVPSLMPPIRLPPKRPNPLVRLGSKLTALGFGDWGRPNLPRYLQQGELPLRSPTACSREWPEYAQALKLNKALCAGTKGQPQGVCSGDYGGPLFIRGRTVKEDLLVGVATFNAIEGCGGGGYSGFTNVATYRGWIDFGVKILKGEANITAMYKSYYPNFGPDPV